MHRHNNAACSEALSLLYSSIEDGLKRNSVEVILDAVAIPILLSISQCFPTHWSSTLAATNDGSCVGSSFKEFFEL